MDVFSCTKMGAHTVSPAVKNPSGEKVKETHLKAPIRIVQEAEVLAHFMSQFLTSDRIHGEDFHRRPSYRRLRYWEGSFPNFEPSQKGKFSVPWSAAVTTFWADGLR